MTHVTMGKGWLHVTVFVFWGSGISHVWPLIGIGFMIGCLISIYRSPKYPGFPGKTAYMLCCLA